MATEPEMKPQGVPSQEGGYERTDAHPGGVFSVVIGMIVAGVIIHFAISGMLNHLNNKPSGKDVWQPRAGGNVAAVRPEIPRLQISPPVELGELRAREDAELNSYGWVNRTSGIVRVPINRAMELMLQKGLPSGAGRQGPSSLELQQQRPQHTAPEIQGPK
jgi:hypothetical protein